MASEFTRAMLARIKEKGGWTWVFDQLGEGKTLGAVAKEIEVSRSFLGNYIRRNKKLSELKHAAWKDAAGYHAERGLEILESVSTKDVVHSKDDLMKAKHLSEYHRWLAEKYDSEFFGTKAKPGTSINLQIGDIGALHIQAIKEARRITAGKKVEAEVITEGGDRQPVDAEIVSEGEDNG